MRVFVDRKFAKPCGSVHKLGGYHLNTLLFHNLNILKQQVEKKFDGIFGISGVEGCQPAGSKVLLSNGEWKNIENISIGDEVISPQEDGTNIFSKVENITSWYSHENYDVVTINRKRKKLYTCSHNHLIPIRYKNKKNWLTNNITAKEYYETYHNKLKYRNGLKSIKFSKFDTTILSYLSFDLEKSTPCQVYGFSLDSTSKSKWYITDNYMVTHNSGKSTFAQAIGYFLSNGNLKLDNIVFSGAELLDRIYKCSVGDVIIYDEAITSMNAQDSATDIQQTLIKTFTMIRSKRLYIILLIPNPFLLRKYFLIFRTKFWLHCFCPDGFTRGYFKFYSYKRKKSMYMLGAKEWDMNAVKPNFIGQFTDTTDFFVSDVEYKKKKEDAIKRLTEDKKTKEMKLKEEYEDKLLKLKINIEQYKEKQKQKNEIIVGTYKEKIKDIKESTKDKNKVRADELEYELDRANLKYKRMIYTFFKFMKDEFEKRYSYTKDYDIKKFLKIVVDNNMLPVKTEVELSREFGKLDEIDKENNGFKDVEA